MRSCAKGPLHRRVIGPFLAWFKGPFRHQICITCHNKKKCKVSVLNILHFVNSFLDHTTFAKNLSKKLPVICKNKKMQAPKFYFLPSKLKLAHKNWFDSHSSFKTHMGNNKAISVSLPKPQEHTFTRWREIAYGHWDHPGQRSHISPTIFSWFWLWSHVVLISVLSGRKHACRFHQPFCLGSLFNRFIIEKPLSQNTNMGSTSSM